MPLLVVALITHVIYNAMVKGWDWGSDTSRKAWDASLAGSASLADRVRRRMADKLAEWDTDPRARGYAAFAVRSTGKVARGLGRAGLWTALKGARATGAVVRALGGGALATGGLLGSLAQSVRDGARDGAQWWERFADGKSERAQSWAERLRNWGRTIPGDPKPSSKPSREPDAAPAGDSSAEPSWEGDGPAPEPPPEYEASWRDATPPHEDPSYKPRSNPQPPEDEPAPAQEPRTEHHRADPKEPEREPYQAGEATVGDPEPETRPPAQDPPAVSGGDASTDAPTPVGSDPAEGTATAGNSPTTPIQPALEGEIVSNTLATPNSTVAPISGAADGIKYEQSQNFLEAQARRAAELASMVEQINQLQAQVQAAAQVMRNDHEQAQAALARFNIEAPAVDGVIEMLTAVAGDPAPRSAMFRAYQALDAVILGCQSDRQNLTQRFGAAWEIMRAQGANGAPADGQFLND